MRMEASMLNKLKDTIAKFISFCSSDCPKTELLQKYCQEVSEILSILKPVLDEITPEVSSDEKLNEEIEGLEIIINVSRELFSSWNSMTSKIYFVIQIETIIEKINKHSIEICQVLCTLIPSAYDIASVFLEKLQEMNYEHISSSIMEATQKLDSNMLPTPEILETVSTFLNLSTNLELFMESIALEKVKSRSNFDQISSAIITLIDHMHENLIKSKQLHNTHGIPIPADFCCPLSLNLMSDPVIVSSGQTYEKVFIKKWIDLGYNVCPKTRNTLGHTTLIPNYTVKQLIANWCESNDIMLPDPSKLLSSSFPQTLIPPSSLNPNSNSNSSSPKSVNNNKILPINGIESNITGLSISTWEEKTGSTSQTSNNNNGTHLNIISSNNDNHLQERVNSGVNSVSRVSTDSDTSSETNQETTPVQPPQTSSSTGTSTIPAQVPVPVQYRYRSERLVPRIVQSSSSESRPDLAQVESDVKKHIEDLNSDSLETVRAASLQLRLLAKHNMENRIVIGNSGAIPPLVGLLRNPDSVTQEHAVTALLNLSINDNNKISIANADSIDPLIHVLRTGSPEAKENSAATLFSLSVIEENKVRIGRSGAIVPLVELLGTGTPRGKKDASTALFNLSIFHENKARIVQAGAVKYLVELMDPSTGMVDKAVAVLANLATIPEGRTAIGQAEGIPVLVEVVELGSSRGKENAAAALLHLCTNSNRFCSQVLQEGAVPPLVALSQSGTPRAREKAQALLSYFRNQRHGNARRG
ncbi:hypothetical protein LUZ60_001886 [Juncus effusus]|nr:hypothetical protein LUZ60_001886 [Juncus effusus]